MIKIYPTQIEAYDDELMPYTLLFKLTVFDADSAELEMKTLVGSSNIDELCEAVKKAVDMLGLSTIENGSGEE
jgi:hypothetical protein